MIALAIYGAVVWVVLSVRPPNMFDAEDGSVRPYGSGQQQTRLTFPIFCCAVAAVTYACVIRYLHPS
jgi:hypothetical protein